MLKEYAEKFEAGPGWLFLTGKDADITQLRVKLGLYSPQDIDGKLQDHNLSLIIGNQKTGQWMKISPHENPYILATQVGSWLHNWKMPPKVQRDYADAPRCATSRWEKASFVPKDMHEHGSGEHHDHDMHEHGNGEKH